jgi:hypothetical protein
VGEQRVAVGVGDPERIEGAGEVVEGQRPHTDPNRVMYFALLRA